MRQRRPRVHDEAHLDFIRQLPCLVTRTRIDVQAAHIKYADRRFGKRHVGIGEKSDDKWTVPLCRLEHLDGPGAQHKGNERAYWERQGIDPVMVAAALYINSGDFAICEEILHEFWSTRKAVS